MMSTTSLRRPRLLESVRRLALARCEPNVAFFHEKLETRGFVSTAVRALCARRGRTRARRRSSVGRGGARACPDIYTYIYRERWSIFPSNISVRENGPMWTLRSVQQTRTGHVAFFHKTCDRPKSQRKPVEPLSNANGIRIRIRESRRGRTRADSSRSSFLTEDKSSNAPCSASRT